MGGQGTGVPKLGYKLTKRLREAGVKPGTPLEVVKKMGLLPDSFKRSPYNTSISSAPGKPPTLSALPPDIKTKETDAQIQARLIERFAIMDKMVNATAVGQNRAFIISGPPGLGKSYSVLDIVESHVAKGHVRSTFVHGFVRSTGLYKTLYENRKPDCIVIFDDADSLFYDDVSLNLLKIACDTMAKRRLSWLAEIRMVDENGLPMPRQFEFHGNVIFITNIDFEALINRGHKLAPHLEALMSRSQYLDLGMKNRRDYLIRIRQVLALGMLSKTGIFAADEKLIMTFIEKNIEHLRELSLRTVLKAGMIFKREGRAKWESTARVLLLK